FVLNLDAAGGMKQKGVVVHKFPLWEKRIQEWLEEMELDYPVGQKMNAYSDHFPFTLRGIPTAEMADPLGSGGRGVTHSPYDTLDKVSSLSLKEAAGLASLLIYRLAQSPKDLFSKRSAEEMQQILDTDPDLEGFRIQRQLDKEMDSL
ncbi:MAG: hypothetical protein D6785_07305, partial [Planctomycetota bacterium]